MPYHIGCEQCMKQAKSRPNKRLGWHFIYLVPTVLIVGLILNIHSFFTDLFGWD
jgi:hypothetical protein